MKRLLRVTLRVRANSDGALTGKGLDAFKRVTRDADAGNSGKITCAEYRTAWTNGVLKGEDTKSQFG